MIAEYGWNIVIAVYLVYALGIGVLTLLTLKVWEKVVEKALKRFKFDREFIDFVRAKYRDKNAETPRT